MSDYALLTPYLMPGDLAKARNVGDGLIAMRIEELLEPHRCVVRLTSRRAPTPSDISKINGTAFVVLGGANQLHDHWEVVAGGLPIIDRIEVPIIPIGVGIDGRSDKTRALSAETRAAITAIHERIPVSSWRCPETTEYLARELPNLADRFTMTGCPVACGPALLRGDPFPTETGTIVVTVTERERFWKRESGTLRTVATAFPYTTRVLALHQNFVAASSWPRSPTHRFALPRGARHLHDLARDLGYEIRVADRVEDAASTYGSCDLHVGSRVHAHLFALSLARRSVVTKVDDRVVGLSRAYGFPIASVATILELIAEPEIFERHRRRVKDLHTTMRGFIDTAIGAKA